MYEKFKDIAHLKSKFPIVEYLAELGILPVCKKNSYALFHAPYRVDKNPSCIVYRNTNTFLDLSTRQKGDIIELVKLMNCCDFKQAVEHLENRTGNSVKMQYDLADRKPLITVLETIKISSWHLKNYLKQRMITIQVADKYCSEVRYVIGDNIYYAIGFKNDKGGYELRSRNYKGCTSKEITTIVENVDCPDYVVFEGFFDFLSYKVIYAEREINAIILNSVCNLKSAIKKLDLLEARNIYVCGDTDIEGVKVFEQLKERYADKCIDMSCFYAQHDCKDLNEYLVKIQHRRAQRV